MKEGQLAPGRKPKKSEGFVPEVEMDVRATGVAPVLVTFIDWGVLEKLISTEPNVSGVVGMVSVPGGGG